jgi:hypothetical protein
LPTGGHLEQADGTGWPCSDRTCSRSRSNSRHTIRPTRIWRSTTVSSSCSSPER